MKFTRMIIVCAGVVFVAVSVALNAQEQGAAGNAAPPYAAKEYGRLLGTPGLSDTMLNNHFKLYQGYVKNTNLLSEKLRALAAEGKDRTPEYAELKRRFGWEFNGMRLHELYFENIGRGKPVDVSGPLYKKIADTFGSYDAWQKDFVATGMMRGIGWSLLCVDPQSGRLFNVWINEHDVGYLAGGVPLLVMDVFEHAYMTDYQLDRAKYVGVFMENIDWDAVSKRYTKD